MNWRSWSWKLIATIFLSVLVFFLTDILYASLLPLGSAPSSLFAPVVRGSAYEPSNLTKLWSDALSRQDNPIKRRLIVTASNSQTVGFEFWAEVPAASTLASRIAQGAINHDPLAFTQVVFGNVSVEDIALQRQEFSPAVWSVVRDSDTVQISLKATRRKIETPYFFIIKIEPSNQFLQIQEDKVVINLNGFTINDVQPVPTDKSDVRVTIAAKPNAPLDATSFSLHFDEDRASLSRRSFLQRFGDVSILAFFFPLIYAIIEVLPLLIFLHKVQESADQKRHKFIRVSVDLLGCLLVLHFVLYLITGISNFFIRGPYVAPFSQGLFAALFPYFPFVPDNLIEFGPLRAGLVILGIFLPAAFWRWWTPPSSTETRSRAIAGSLVAVLALALLWALGLLIRQQSSDGGPLPLWVWMVLCISVAALLLVGIFWILYRLFDPKNVSFSIVVFSVYALIALGVINALEPRLESIRMLDYSARLYTDFVTSVILGTILVYALIRIVYLAVQKVRQEEEELDPPPMSAWVWVAAAFLAIPLRGLTSSAFSLAYQFDVIGLAHQVDNFLLFLWLAWGTWFLHRRGRQGLELYPFTCEIGILLAASALFSITSRWFYIPITFLLGWSLLKYIIRPQQEWREELEPLYDQVVNKRNELLEEIINVNAAERAHWDYRKKLGEKLVNNETTVGEFDRGLKQRRAQLDCLQESARIGNLSYKEVALVFGPFPTAWRNAVHGAVWAAIFAAPWILLNLSKLLLDTSFSNAFPFLDFLHETIYLASRWISIGFFFGYFYPYLRGRTGIEKGLGFFAVLFLASLPLALIYRSSASNWLLTVFLGLQLLIECLLLGSIAFDYWTLRRGGRGWQMLLEIQGLTVAGISASTILAAVSGVISFLFTPEGRAIIAAASDFLLEFISPGSSANILPH